MVWMAIPSKTLEAWTKYESAAIKSAENTHTHIQDTLNNDDRISNHDHIRLNTVLQGSYANHTIVRGASDVDVLAINEKRIHSNTEDFTAQELLDYWDDITLTTYCYEDYRNDILQALTDNYGSIAVQDGSKAIELHSDRAPGLELDADAVPVLRYKQYDGYPGKPTKGIAFKDDDGNWITNFPEQHRKAATRIHDETNKRYKPTIRMFKNARNKLVADGGFDKGTAPSYFIECLLSNIDQEIIDTNDLQTRFFDVIVSLPEEDWSSFTAQHGLRKLFGDQPEQWNAEDAVDFIIALADLWDNWENYT